MQYYVDAADADNEIIKTKTLVDNLVLSADIYRMFFNTSFIVRDFFFFP